MGTYNAFNVKGFTKPNGVIGTREIQPPDATFPKFRRECTIRIGRPVDPARYRNRGDDRMVLRQITDEVMFEIRELTGQEYRNVYAGTTAETEPTETARVATTVDTDARQPSPA